MFSKSSAADLLYMGKCLKMAIVEVTQMRQFLTIWFPSFKPIGCQGENLREIDLGVLMYSQS